MIFWVSKEAGMLTRDYYFDLPSELIAQEPSERRGEDRLLLLDRRDGRYEDHMMADFPSLLQPRSVMVVNSSKVRKARVYGRVETGGLVEFLFLSPNADGSWKCMVKKAKKQREGKRYAFQDRDGNTVREGVIRSVNPDATRDVVFSSPVDESFFDLCGHVPLPPYIKREDSFSDETRYQTVYARTPGSVAAPTAGLHFTKDLMESVRFRQISRVLFFVGAVVMVLGIAVYMLWSETGGVVMLIAGMVVAVISLSITRLFSAYDMSHWLDRTKPPRED